MHLVPAPCPALLTAEAAATTGQCVPRDVRLDAAGSDPSTAVASRPSVRRREDRCAARTDPRELDARTGHAGTNEGTRKPRVRLPR